MPLVKKANWFLYRGEERKKRIKEEFDLIEELVKEEMPIYLWVGSLSGIGFILVGVIGLFWSIKYIFFIGLGVTILLVANITFNRLMGRI